MDNPFRTTPEKRLLQSVTVRNGGWVDGGRTTDHVRGIGCDNSDGGLAGQ
jgi:hypothetical protein